MPKVGLSSTPQDLFLAGWMVSKSRRLPLQFELDLTTDRPNEDDEREEEYNEDIGKCTIITRMMEMEDRDGFPRVKKLRCRLLDRKINRLYHGIAFNHQWDFAQLQTLTIDLVSRSYAGAFLGRGTEITLFEKAPILREVVLHNVRDEAKHFAVPSVAGLFRIPWDQIERYEGHGFPAHTMISLLRTTPSLAKFSFEMERGDQRVKDRL